MSALIVGSLLIVLFISILVVSDDRAKFSGGSFDAIERALQSAGLHICDTVDVPNGQANQAAQSRQYDVAFNCATADSGDTGEVVADRYTHRDDRDDAMRNLEVLVRPRGNGVAYTYGTFSIYVFGQSDDTVQNTINLQLRKIGAK